MVSPYIKFCSVECVDEAYRNRQIDQEILDYALKLIKKTQSQREEEISNETLRDLFFIEILKINNLLSRKEYDEDKKELLGE